MAGLACLRRSQWLRTRHVLKAPEGDICGIIAAGRLAVIPNEAICHPEPVEGSRLCSYARRASGTGPSRRRFSTRGTKECSRERCRGIAWFVPRTGIAGSPLDFVAEGHRAAYFQYAGRGEFCPSEIEGSQQCGSSMV